MTTPSRKPETVPRDETIIAYGPARSTVKGTPLSMDELRNIDAYWQASLYLCLGMLYLMDNPLHQAAATWPLGFGPRTVLYLHSLQPADQQIRP